MENITLNITDFNEQDAISMSKWIYDGEYSIYNCPDWEIIKDQKWAMTVEDKRKSQFRKVTDQNGRYLGYFRFFPMDDKMMLGLGMNPEYCGKHLGPEFVSKIVSYILSLHNNKAIELEVRSFNARAVKCYSKCGFETIGKKYKETLIGNDTFIIMQYDAMDA